MHTPLTVQASWNGVNAFKSRTPHMHAKRPGSAARKYQMYDIFPYSAKKGLWVYIQENDLANTVPSLEGKSLKSKNSREALVLDRRPQLCLNA